MVVPALIERMALYAPVLLDGKEIHVINVSTNMLSLFTSFMRQLKYTLFKITCSILMYQCFDILSLGMYY